jgi:hypothetical protein
VALNGFKRLRKTIIHDFIVAGYHPYLSFVFHSNLCRAEHVAGRMEGKSHSIDVNGLIKGNGFQMNFTQSMFDYRCSALCTHIILVTPPRMIGVSMRDQSTPDRSPWIDVYVGRCAINTSVSKLQ